ncbi:MAG TPA: phytanoyl-CoA dioxygenase family protein [Polyangiaceae bacterium]|nr:phytanoyl-CoA dioxygenase family protein [Polyangiaceae bacterium]
MTAQRPAQLSAQQRVQYDRQGYWIARSLLSAGEAAELGQAFSELGKDGPVVGISDCHVAEARPDDPLRHWPRMMNPHRHPEYEAGRLTLRTMLDARITDLVWDLIGDEPIAGQSMFYFKPPGARGQALHQDNFYLKVRPGSCMAAWIAIDDSKQDNGGLYVVPGTQDMKVECPEQADLDQSFVREYIPVPDGRKAVPALLEPGDVLFFNGSVIHGSEPNRSQRFRRSLIYHYMPWSSREISHWYHPLLRVDGSVVEREASAQGGPCGEAELTAPH